MKNTNWLTEFKIEQEGFWNSKWKLSSCYFRLDSMSIDTVGTGFNISIDTICCIDWKMPAKSGEIIRHEEYSSPNGNTVHHQLNFTICKNDFTTGAGTIHVVNKKRGILAIQSWTFEEPFYCASCTSDTFQFCHDIENNEPEYFMYTIYEKGKVCGEFSSFYPMNYSIHSESKNKDEVWITGDEVRVVDWNFPQGIIVGLNDKKISQ